MIFKALRHFLIKRVKIIEIYWKFKLAHFNQRRRKKIEIKNEKGIKSGKFSKDISLKHPELTSSLATVVMPSGCK